MSEPRILKTVRFYCHCCRNTYDTEPSVVTDEPDPAEIYHPWRYESYCPRCREVAQQDGRERGRLKASFNGNKGPKSPEGIAAVTANLAGHPTPAEAKKTRFNALKHGLYSTVALFFPAKPGKYPQCKTCPYYSYFGDESEAAFCVELPGHGHKNPHWCQLRTELYMKHRQAFDDGDPKQLIKLNADRQATISAITDDMALAIIADGVRSETPEWYSDKEGGFHLARYTDDKTGETVQIMKREAHPLLNTFMNFIQRNNMTLADLGMTPKVQDENDILSGHVGMEKADQELAEAVQKKQLQMMELLRSQLEDSKEKGSKDTVMLEFNQQDAHG